MIPTKNTGVLIGRRETDYLGGTLPYEVRNQSGDWRKFLPIGEKQKDPAETMSCVTHSALSDIEIQGIQQTGIEVNYEDHFTANASGTTHQGNYLWKVADSIRLDGVVLQGTWSAPVNYTWDTYYTPIPQTVKDKAIHPDIAYEWVFKKDFAYHLKHAPLQITIPDPPNHAVVLVHISGDTGYYFDSYSPFLKTIKMSLVSDAALKIVYNAKPMFPIKKVKVVIDNKPAWGVAVITPNMINISLAEDEVEWRSYSKPDSYAILSVNPDDKTNWDVDAVINL
jgi:hypothetical protein